MPRLTKAGISFYTTMMLGSGGKGKALEVATETAKLLNQLLLATQLSVYLKVVT